jgi:hypothetical protein
MNPPRLERDEAVPAPRTQSTRALLRVTRSDGCWISEDRGSAHLFLQHEADLISTGEWGAGPARDTGTSHGCAKICYGGSVVGHFDFSPNSAAYLNYYFRHAGGRLDDAAFSLFAETNGDSRSVPHAAIDLCERAPSAAEELAERLFPSPVNEPTQLPNAVEMTELARALSR